jgi:hypothetical protein
MGEPVFIDGEPLFIGDDGGSSPAFADDGHCDDCCGSNDCIANCGEPVPCVIVRFYMSFNHDGECVEELIGSVPLCYFGGDACGNGWGNPFPILGGFFVGTTYDPATGNTQVCLTEHPFADIPGSTICTPWGGYSCNSPTAALVGEPAGITFPEECADSRTVIVPGCVCDAPVTYDCVDGVCTDPFTGGGEFSTLALCIASSCQGPSCTGLTLCDPLPSLTVIIIGFEDSGVDYEDGGFFHWLYSVLNHGYLLDSAVHVAPELLVGGCASATWNNFISAFGNYYADDDGSGLYPARQADPGDLVEQWRFFHSYEDRLYACAEIVVIGCTDGQVSVESDTLIIQGWRFLWDGVGYNTPSIYIPPYCQSYGSPFDKETAPTGLCGTHGGAFSSHFHYSKYGGDEGTISVQANFG